MSEKEFMQQVVDLARLTGRLVFHAHDSRRSEPGFPDLCIVGKDSEKPLFVELKVGNNTLSEAQREWGHYLNMCPGADYRVWRPSDWPEIEHELKGATRG